MEISKYTKIVLSAAQKRGVKYEALRGYPHLFLLRKNDKHTFVFQSTTELIPSSSSQICANKYLTNLILRRSGFPIPQFIISKEKKDFVKFLKKYKNIVIKPIFGNQGKGITVGITNEKQIDFALKKAGEAIAQKDINNVYASYFLAQKVVCGFDHRLLVLNYKDVFVIKKVPAYVVGDARHTIEQLIRMKNNDKKGHQKDIIIDESLEFVLRQQKLTLKSVLPRNKTVYVRNTSNLATGGESIDVTHLLGKRAREMAIDVARTLGMPLVGLDFMTFDIGAGKGYFLEANHVPGLLIHHFPQKGQPRQVSNKLIELLIKKGVL